MKECVADVFCPAVLSTVTLSNTSFTVFEPQAFGIVMAADVAVVASAPADAVQVVWLAAGPALRFASSVIDAMLTPAGNSHSTFSGCPNAASAGLLPAKFLNTTGGRAGGGGLPPLGGGFDPSPDPPQPAMTRSATQSNFF